MSERDSGKVLGAVVLTILGVIWTFCWYWTGKRVADVWYAKNPVMVEYRKQQIIVTPGDAICPEGHICTWKPWDLTANEVVGAPKPQITSTGKVKCGKPCQQKTRKWMEDALLPEKAIKGTPLPPIPGLDAAKLPPCEKGFYRYDVEKQIMQCVPEKEP